jgi:hypothetical protein
MTTSNSQVADVVEGLVEAANDRGIRVGGERVLGTSARKPPARMSLRRSLRRFDSENPRPRAWVTICRPAATSASGATGAG